MIQNSNPISNLRRGFTIVELLVVVVVISILATITIVTYEGVQERGRDAQRVSDAKAIEKAIDMYRSENLTLPAHVTPSWESSYVQAEGQFMKSLVDTDSINEVPVDPINDATHHYRFYRYPAGNSGCDPARGAFIVFQIIDLEDSPRPAPKSPGFSCSGRNWTTEADYVFGVYTN